MTRLSVLAALLMWAASCGAQEPSSNIRVQVDSATVTELDCSARGFALEQTKETARWYSYIAHGMRTEEWDPRPVVMGTLGCVLLTPITILAVPVDVFSAPFRRQCSFRVTLEGSLAGWAGQTVGVAEVDARAVNVVEAGVPGVSEPVVLLSSGSSVSDSRGRFSLSFPARMVRSKDLSIRWVVRGLPSGQVRLRKKGGRFLLDEQESEFGMSMRFEEVPPRLIIPERKKK